MTDGPEGTFVDSGSFGVDRTRALDKLMRFQLPDPDMFLLPLIRCAVAGGATAVRIQDGGGPGAAVPGAEPFSSRGGGGGLEIRFDGRAFSKSELADPYACLFGGSAPGLRRNRHLAVGLLSSLRLNPTLVSVASGVRSRHRLRVWSPESETLEESPVPGRDTAVTVADGRAEHPEALAHVRACCGMVPIPIHLGEEELPRLPAAEIAGVRMRLDIPAAGPRADSALRASVDGVCVGELLAALPLAQVEGHVDDARFSMNASQTGITRDTVLQEALLAVAAGARELLLETARTNGAALEKAAAILIASPELIHYWKDWREDGSAPSLPEEREPDIRLIRRAARATAWLRDACARLLSEPAPDAADPVRKALWEAPLFWGVSGRTLSHLNLRSQRGQLGYLPYAVQRPQQAPSAFEAVWCPSGEDRRALEPRFQKDLRDVGENLSEREAAPSRPRLERAGILSLLIRDSLPPSAAAGEVGLSLPPPRKDSRVHLFCDGHPKATVSIVSPLRFDAVVELPDGADRERALAAVHSTAASLYRRLAEGYDPLRAADSGDAIREHLLDYLLWSRGSAGPAENWALELPLLRCDDRWVSLRHIRERLAQGHCFQVSSDPGLPPGEAGGLLRIAGRAPRPFLAQVLPEATFEPVAGNPELQLMLLKPAGSPAASAAADPAAAAETAALSRGYEELGAAPVDPLRFEEAMLFSRRYREQGLDCLLGLPHRFPPPAPVFLKGGHEAPRPKSLAAVVFPCALVADLTRWRNPDPGALDAVLRRRLSQFFTEYAKAGSFSEEAADCLLQFFGDFSSDLPPADAAALRSLPLFRSLGGGTLSLDALAAAVRRDGQLAFAEQAAESVSPEDRDVPILRRPEAVLRLLAGEDSAVPLRRSAAPPGVRRGAPRPGRPRRPAQVEAPPPPALVLCHGLLLRNLGRRGIQLTAGGLGTEGLRTTTEGPLAAVAADGGLEVNLKHPLAAAVLASGLPDRVQAAYLATAAFTELNRQAAEISDLDDARFQQSLAEDLAARPADR